MSPNRFFKILAFLLFAGAQRSVATQIVVVVTHDGIVIASDSKQRASTNTGLSDSPELADKVIMLNDRVAVAVVGAGSLRFLSGTETVYRFDPISLLDAVKHSLPANASESLIESIIVDKLKSAMDGLSPYIANGFFNKQNAPEGDIVDFIVAGYENEVPLVRKIRVECDWDARKIASPVVESKNPLPNRPVDSNIIFFGRNSNIINATDPTTPEWKAASSRYPGVITGIDVFIHSRIVSSAEGKVIAADLIRLEAEFDPENVGLPMNIVVLSNDHSPVVSVLTK